MKKVYFVELREDEAEELMEEHWIGELVLCKDCKHGEKCVEPHKDYWCNLYDAYKYGGWFCADGERIEENVESITGSQAHHQERTEGRI